MTIEKALFVQPPFSQSALKYFSKIHFAKILLFFLHYLIRGDQNHSSNLNSKTLIKCLIRSLKKLNRMTLQSNQSKASIPSIPTQLI